MLGERIRVIAKREYLTRIKSKAFWLGTIALPLLLAAFFLLPALLLVKTRTSQRLVTVDETGKVARALEARLQERRESPAAMARFDLEIEEPGANRETQRRELNRRILAGEIDAWLWIGPEALANGRVEYYAASVSNFVVQEILKDELSEVIRRIRLEEAGYDPDEVGELARSISLATVRVTEKGERAEGALAGVAMAYFLFFVLYMVLILYGQQVMNGVLEEKGSRVVEIMVSTVRPFELMMGKLLGIGAVGLTQLVIWLASIAALTAPGLVASLAWLPEEVGIPTLSLGLILHFLALFLLGYFVYSSFYAAIGASFNNLQEAQQFASFGVLFLVAPVVFFYAVVNDPDSTLSVVTSLIPCFTPLLMMLRIAVKTPPAWQIALGYVLTALFTLFMVWLAGRIYRVGILMYGKKPTVRELWRWVRYA